MTATVHLPLRGSATARARAALPSRLALLHAAGLATAPAGSRGTRVAGSPHNPVEAAARARAQAERERAERKARLRAVPTRQEASRGLAIVATVLFATVLFSGILGIVALNALAAEASFQARALERDISDLTLRHDDLVAAVAQLESPNRVREVAVGQLGLMEPESPGFLVVDPDDIPRTAPKAVVELRNSNR